MHQKYSVAVVTLFVPLLVAVVLAWQSLSTLAFVAFTELALLVFAVHLLSRNLPRKLKSASKHNCFRLDGTRSEHRTYIESSAKRKLQTDICGSLLVVLLIGNGLALAVHSYVIPLPLGLAAMASFQPDRQAWREGIEQRNIDFRFKQNVQENHRLNPQEAEQAAASLWDAWPMIVLVGIIAALAAQAYVGTMYQRSLAEYAKGIAFRAEEYARCDISRLQHEYEVEAARATESSPS
jgi:hypothetical protein